jgi:hypothetical protein
MAKRLLQANRWLQVGLCLAMAAGLASGGKGVFAQSLLLTPSPVAGQQAAGTSIKSSVPPSFSIAVEPLGFSAPGPIYLGQRYSLASLDFFDENRLLFTFRVPGLLHRESRAGEDEDSDEHHMRALVLELPTGAVQAEAVWTLHDRARYLWMLKDGHFLLRDGNDLKQGDATLVLKPFLHFPGPLLSVDLDPAQLFLATNSREPAADSSKPGATPSPADAKAVTQEQKLVSGPDLVVRILRRDSGQVVAISHVRAPVHLSINRDGYLESLRAKDTKWLLNLHSFTGGSSVVGRVDSTCSPVFDFVSQMEVLVGACTSSGERKLVAMASDGLHLWEKTTPDTQVWSRLVMGQDGSRLVREAMVLSHALSASAPFGADDVQGQIVEVLNAANGKVALTAQASPVLDAGGNVAISPSGRRVAVLSGGAIQIFDLPAPPPLPSSPDGQAGR